MDKKIQKSKFFLVRCNCGNEQYIFSNIASEVKCVLCKKRLAKPTGGKSKLFGKVIKGIK
jgi:small subunit ribosomal protein S27e